MPSLELRILGAALFGTSGQASAAPLPQVGVAGKAASPIEKAGYKRWYRHHYPRRYWGGPYWRHYGYNARPYWYGHRHKPYRRYGWGY